VPRSPSPYAIVLGHWHVVAVVDAVAGPLGVDYHRKNPRLAIFSLCRSDHGQITQRLHGPWVCAGHPVQMRSFEVTGTAWRSLMQRWGPWEWKIIKKILDWPFLAAVGPVTAKSHSACTSCRCAQVAHSRCDRLRSLARLGGRLCSGGGRGSGKSLKKSSIGRYQPLSVRPWPNHTAAARLVGVRRSPSPDAII
jgi:hypothetical protein